MANLNKTRTLFAFTSPRTIEKIIPEIRVLVDSFSNKEWNEKTQISFFNKLYDSEFYEGGKKPTNIPLAARDRITRAPKALGFVDLKPKIGLTEAGKQLLSSKRTSEIITRQLFKFQLPSPYHKIPADRNFNVKPYLELLRVVKKLGSITKIEIAIFFLQLTHYNKFDTIIAAIENHRAAASKNNGNRKAFIEAAFKKEILKIYSSEVKANNIKTRESDDVTIDKFVRTKMNNQIDYADAFIRYLRATQLISFDKKFHIIIAPGRAAEVDFILKNVNRVPQSYKTEADYKEYLFDPSSLLLLYDNREFLEKRLSSLSVRYAVRASAEELKNLLEMTELNMVSSAIEEAESGLKNYVKYDDIMSVFEKIQRNEVPDRSLYLEWNVWRSIVMINYAKQVKGNFTRDIDGIPLCTALGNMPDIESEYDGFKIVIEVTMSSGNKQYEMEGEPVARHFGKIQKISDVPVYCLFIAPKISEGALAHFFNLNKMNTKAYGGKTRIVPMNLRQFLSFITIARDKKLNNSKILKSFFDNIIQKNFSLEDENLWFQNIQDSIPNWTN